MKWDLSPDEWATVVIAAVSVVSLLNSWMAKHAASTAKSVSKDAKIVSDEAINASEEAKKKAADVEAYVRQQLSLSQKSSIVINVGTGEATVPFRSAEESEPEPPPRKDDSASS